ncbi:SART-1 protein [Annulohypoxylon bovei var. microspora]|nr:SART-1 protein [Annulohypoxylon bovei var. microspora]
MDAAAIEETNRLRVSLGMKPLPVPGAGPQFKEKADTPAEDLGSTLETREAAAYDNYKKIQDGEKNKKKREAKAAAIKKARDAAKRAEVIEGKGLGDVDEGELDTKAWLISQKKRQKKIDKARKMEAELAAAEAEAAAAVQYTSKDLAGVKVGHEFGSFEDGEEQILTLKDSNILGDEEEEGDELENINLRERERLDKKLESKKKKPIYDPNEVNETGEQSLLAQYDEEIIGKKSKRFTLDGFGNTPQSNDLGSLEAQSQQRQKISLDFLKDDLPASDYMDISEIKVKKPKKKKSKSTRQRPVDEDDIFPLPAEGHDQSMDIDSGATFISRKRKTDDTAFVDDEDLQATLAAQRRVALKKRKRTRPEDIARQLREEGQTPDDNEIDDANEGGLVLDEISEFVSGLKKEDIEDRKPRKAKSPGEAPVTAMEEESDEDEPMKDGDDLEHDRVKREESTPAETAVIGVDEEKTIGSGIGAALQLLRERQLLKDSSASDLNETQRQHQIFIAEKKRKLADIEQQARDQRERDRNSGRLDRMTVREREEWARQQNNMRDQQTSRQLVDLFSKGYKPNVELKYHDELGRSLDQKEAFKHLSHQFHGKGSGKGKTDKRLKKIEDEKRRESQSMLDASQNVGMSSATAQQTKKRKEAGVRLA